MRRVEAGRLALLLAVAGLLGFGLPAAAGAQQLEKRFADLTAAESTGAAVAPQETPGEPSLERVIAGGALLGIGGFLAGGLLAARLANDCTEHEFCQLEAAFYGAAAGGTLGLATGVHLANRRRGNVALDFLTGAVIWGVGIGIAASIDWSEAVTWTAFVGVPIAQLAATVAVERAVGRARAGE